MASPPPDIVETGAPAFVVLGPEAMGLSTVPTDLHILPDGRILAVALRELAFSDGTRWEVFRAAEGQSAIPVQVAVDGQGQIYAGTGGAIARVDLEDNARWKLTRMVNLPDDRTFQSSTMTKVAVSPGRWRWFGAGGMVSWRPGEVLRGISHSLPIEYVFSVGDSVFLSDSTAGWLSRILPDGAIERISPSTDLINDAVLSSLPFAPGQVLVGTAAGTLKLFDGKTFQPFAPGIMPTQGGRVMDLCAVGQDLFAAAVDTIGIIFFNREGRIVQVLERSLDHRLRRVRRVVSNQDGVVWAILNEGVARVEFPSPISYFEPLLASGLNFAQPVRHADRLWILAEGRALRGNYTSTGRLEHFEEDSPPGKFLFTLSACYGELFAANEVGIYRRHRDEWELVLPGIVNARIGFADARTRGWPYIARGEFGFVSRTDSGFSAERIPVLGLEDNYNAVEDGTGMVWVELGSGRTARIDYRTAEKPTMEIFGLGEGLLDGWIEIYLLEGIALFHVADHVFRFDDATRKFVDERELLKRYPHLPTTFGRPILDAQGRFWHSREGRPRLREKNAAGVEVETTLPVGFAPTGLVLEENGVAWLTASQHLVRYDRRVAPPTPRPLRAMITAVHFSASNRHLFKPGTTLAPLDYADNALVVHYAAPANPFGPPIHFEMQLEGAGTQWRSTGTVASAAFNRLKEGNYTFRVRPVTASDQRGEEARLEFTVRPPWYRTPLAWTIYVISAAGLLAAAAWLSAYLQRREKERLEQLVTKRTEELASTNLKLGRQIAETTEKSTALSASEERYRTLNADLEKRVVQRTAELSLSNAELQHRESLFRLIFEHAPVGISWKRTDLGGAYHLNATYRRILNLEGQAMTNATPLAQLIHPDDAPRQAELNRRIQSGETDSYNVDVRLRLAGDRIVWGSLSVAVVRDEAGQIVQDIGILEDISARKNAEEELAKTYKNLVEASRVAGMAEVATGVLHNVGNVLNSLNVSSSVIAGKVRRSKVDSLVKLAALVNENAGRLGEFLEQDPKGRLVPEFLTGIAEHSIQERDWLLQEMASMQKNIDHIKDIVVTQQGYASAAGVIERIEPAELFEDALRMSSATLVRDDVGVIREFGRAPAVSVEKGKVLQILVNLIRNAKHACDEAPASPGRKKTIVLRIELREPGKVRLLVRDNGVGIPEQNLTRIFVHGFTTRSNGHGFGLHSSALAAKEMGGSLTAFSAGPGEGATFTLELPLAPERIAGELPRSDRSTATAVME